MDINKEVNHYISESISEEEWLEYISQCIIQAISYFIFRYLHCVGIVTQNETKKKYLMIF